MRSQANSILTVIGLIFIKSTWRLHGSRKNEICVGKRSFPQNTPYLFLLLCKAKEGTLYWANDTYRFLTHTISFAPGHLVQTRIYVIHMPLFFFCDPRGFFSGPNTKFNIYFLCSTRYKSSGRHPAGLVTRKLVFEHTTFVKETNVR